jgi:hypothetical protein
MDPGMHLIVDLEKGNSQINGIEPLSEPPNPTKASQQSNKAPPLDDPPTSGKEGNQINPDESLRPAQMTAQSTGGLPHIFWDTLKVREPSGRDFPFI